jgi:SAM-dependent methyltransferase/uncharacterized protein YbaR (Trm112 family)
MDSTAAAGILSDLTTILACPACRVRLIPTPKEFLCTNCTRAYPVVDGIPLLVLDLKAAEHDELQHHGAGPRHTQRERQTEFFDRQVEADFEITRPHGTPALYRWYYEEKFHKSIAPIEPLLQGATVLTVCGGSGMDADFLACCGARVITSDLSLGAARRARERARRYDLPIEPIVADVEQLPFSDGAVDIVYVHDGLHHIENPLDGLGEMARVARLALSLTEPADAFATMIAVWLGLASETEEAGNHVARLRQAEIIRFLHEHGFGVKSSVRYAMYYKHKPGRLLRLLSKPGMLTATQAAVIFGNLLIGRWGNRLAITAERLSRTL